MTIVVLIHALSSDVEVDPWEKREREIFRDW